MTDPSKPPIRLIGELRIGGADWDRPAFAAVFERLGSIQRSDVLTRYLRYYGVAGGRTEVRFFGIDAEVLHEVPERMAALVIGNDTLTVSEPTQSGRTANWHGDLTWKWLSRGAGGAPVGEFTVSAPARWTSGSEPAHLEFEISANAYFERGRALDDDVHLVEYDPGWPEKFEQMATWIRVNVPRGIVLRVEHYGSTAIPDMPAKPVIDILLEIPSFAEARESLIPIFNRPECEYWWYADHMMFIVREGKMGKRAYHIHAAPAGHPIWEGIAFRDYLVTHPGEASSYAALKRALAARHLSDREAYTESKNDFVREVTSRALKHH